MTTDAVEPAGFPDCPSCALREYGTSWTCWDCASKTLPPLGAQPCPVCCQTTDGSACRNLLCRRPSRSIDRIEAIAKYSGPLRSTINRYKGDNKVGWAPIFGRILLGYLEANHHPDDFDIIVANPTHESRVPRHTELMIDHASNEDWLDEWAWDDTDPRLLQKGAATSGSGVAGATRSSKEAAAQEVHDALVIRDPALLDGARVLVVDDICTTGLQLDAVARRLKAAGAAQVTAVVLARTPWGP